MGCRASTLVFAIALAGAPARAEDTGIEVYRALGLKPEKVLVGTVLTAPVVAGGAKQVVALVTYFTGKQEKSDAVNVRLAVFDRRGTQLVSLYARDFGAERGGYVGGGDLQLVDLDRDGLNEIIVSFDSFEDPLIEQRLAEVILLDGTQFRSGWSGLVKYDATRDARNVPVERRDRYTRVLDIPETLRTRGVTLFTRKEILAIAGERLSQPRVVAETFPLRPGERGR